MVGGNFAVSRFKKCVYCIILERKNLLVLCHFFLLFFSVTLFAQDVQNNTIEKLQIVYCLFLLK